jgi:hypothetical protein
MRRVRSFPGSFVSMLNSTVVAQEPPRLALLTGNQAYADKTGALKNPTWTSRESARCLRPSRGRKIADAAPCRYRRDPDFAEKTKAPLILRPNLIVRTVNDDESVCTAGDCRCNSYCISEGASAYSGPNGLQHQGR